MSAQKSHGRGQQQGGQNPLPIPLGSLPSCGKRGGSPTQQGALNSYGPGANFLLLNHKLFLASAQLQKSHKKAKLLGGGR